jgi:hypothetical protein
MELTNILDNKKVIDSYIGIGSWLWITLEQEIIVEISGLWHLRQGDAHILDSESSNMGDVHSLLLDARIIDFKTEKRHQHQQITCIFDNGYTLEARVENEEDLCVHLAASKEVFVFSSKDIILEQVPDTRGPAPTAPRS